MTENVHVDAVQAEPVWLGTDGTTDYAVHLTVYEQMQLVFCYHANSPTIDGPQIRKYREDVENYVIVHIGLQFPCVHPRSKACRSIAYPSLK